MTKSGDQPNGVEANCTLESSRVVKDLARINSALKTLSAGNRCLLRATDERELLHEMCRVIVESGGFRSASVGYAEHGAQKNVKWVVGVGIETDLLDTFHYTWADTERGQSASATAIRTGEPIVGRNLSTDPVYAGPAYAVAHNLVHIGHASVTAFPLRVQGEVLGALTISAAEPDAFEEDEVKLLNELADDLAYGIANLRTRTQHRAAQATIARLAYFDTLTGLPNRELLLEALEAAMHEAQIQHCALALLHLEVGRFHEINKVLGYRSGDLLLRELGRRLAQEVQNNVTLARVGEAEFALLFPQMGEVEAIQAAQRLVTSMHQPVEVSGLMVDAHVGIGIAVFPNHATDAEVLIRCANAAMHQAKPMHGSYAIYTGGLEQESTRRLSLMGDLHRAIANDELRLYCQPKVDLTSRCVAGAEALVRWQHPLHGMISPVEFIPLAEQAGMITPLTNWMLEASFRQSYAWHDAGRGHPLAVNLSALDLYDPSFIDRVRGLFSNWGIAPELIQFELTESALMIDPMDALETLIRLKQLGVQLFVDDFGIGHSSLSYLQRLPVDAVKIDQSFVMQMVGSIESAVIVRSTIELGHNLGLKVVAEGVESQAIWERLATLGCDVAQGYFIGKPMPADQFAGWDEQWSQTCSG